MTYKTISFAKARSMDKKGIAAIVIRGAGAEGIRDGWINGINEQLVDEGIFKSPMNEIYLLPTLHEDRVDIVMVYGDEQKPEMGRMAMWRIGWQGDISWLEDYIVNDGEYAHGVEADVVEME